MGTLTLPTPEGVARFTRVVAFADAAIGAELSATAGQGPRRLTSLMMVAEFLRPVDETSEYNFHDTVNYVSPVGLAKWVGETIGDVELGEAMLRIAQDGRAYGFQVHDLRALLLERFAQYQEAVAVRPVSVG